MFPGIKIPFSNAHEMNQKFYNLFNGILIKNGRKNTPNNDILELSSKVIQGEPTSLQKGYFGNPEQSTEIGRELIEGVYSN